MGRLLLLVALLLLDVAVALERKIPFNTDHSVDVQMSDGTTRTLTGAEFEELAKERAEQQLQVQKAHGESTANDETRWEEEDVEHIQHQDSEFALHIELARRAFHELQRHGYAQGYVLAGFSEQEKERGTGEYYVELLLQAKKDLKNTDVVTKTGTGTRKGEKEGEERPVSYEVQLLLDSEKNFSLVAAWELSDEEPPQGQRRARVMRLSIQPTTALLERKAKQGRARPAVMIWLLAGGLGLVAAGVLIMYNTRNPMPAPKPRRRSSDVWELVDENDNPVKMEKSDKKRD